MVVPVVAPPLVVPPPATVVPVVPLVDPLLPTGAARGVKGFLPTNTSKLPGAAGAGSVVVVVDGRTSGG
jgi:hypothetical protein